MNNSEVWSAVLSELELSISKANFITWFKNTGIIALMDGRALICVPNTFARAWLEKKYQPAIIQSLERVTGKPIKKLEYKIDNIKNVSEQGSVAPVSEPTEIQNFTPTPHSTEQTFSSKSVSPLNQFNLNPKYNFGTFVVGKGSELAYAAAQAVAERPGVAYNPLFIYGGVGLGKTHLLQAIGNEMLRKNADCQIMYVSAERFTNDFISSVKEKTAKEFQNRYRHIDLLLIDDIQFMAGKEGTQESFFHTFNELHQNNKQVVITSDRPPKAIPALEDRLRSRFEWGMIADVSMPDFETRVAILEKKATEKQFQLSQEVIRTIAATVQNNIRELEGALNRIMVFHQLKNITPNVETVKSLLMSVDSVAARRSLTPRQLAEVVGGFYNISQEDLMGKSREKKLSFPRQIIMFLLREELKMSYPAIGEELGGRDHTTAMHAHTKILNEIEKELKLRQEIELIKQRLYANNV